MRRARSAEARARPDGVSTGARRFGWTAALAGTLACAPAPAARVPASPAAGANASVAPSASAASLVPSATAAPPPETPDAPFRASPPAAGSPVTWEPPRALSFVLGGGVHVLLVPRHDLPIVAVRVVTGGGAGDLPAQRPGAVAFMGAMLEQGAGKRGALAISDEYEAIGAEHGAGCDWDACVARVKVLSSRLGPALDLLADIVLRPSFADDEIQRTRRRWLAGLQAEKSSPQAAEQNTLAAVLYGRANPYGHALRGAPGDVTELTRAEIQRAWAAAFTARKPTIVVAGDVSADALRALLEPRFGAWRAPAAAPPARGPAAAPKATKSGVRVALVDFPGAAQSQVFVAEEGAPFATEDRIPLHVMNAILGGMFSSRINLDLREARAFTYGAHSRFALRHGAGPFVAGGAIFAEHTGEAARALLAQVARIRDEPVTDEELALAKENAKLALPARFEGVDDVAGALQELAVYGLPLDDFATRAARIDRVTAADVMRVAKQWLRPETMQVIVTGDRARVASDLGAIGPVEVRDAYGDPILR